MPDKRLPYLALSLGLSVAILAFLLTVNAHYLFHAQLYEDDDLASDSLGITRATHFHELYGQYSRWGFHHPGPAMIYAFAWGELLLYRTLHLVPTPYNAHVIVSMIMASGFLAGGIGVAARWVRSAVFAPLTLLLAATHLATVNPRFWATSPWMAYMMMVPFFCLLVAAASVGAGRGGDLPLLVLAGGVMLNTHVAQPFFIGPLFIVAYAGLTWACRHDAEGLWPWRRYPRTHAFAAALGVPFVLPIGVDLWLGARSNAALILRHMHVHQGERHPWLDSVFYFLRFGTYEPSHPGPTFSPTGVTPGQIGHFIHEHLLMTAVWVAAPLLPLLALACRRWVKPRGAAYADHSPAPPGRWRFLGWLAAVWMLATALTIAWGHIQDGTMYYFNSWFTYGIYLALVPLVEGAVSDILELAVAHERRPRLWTAAAGALCAVVTVGSQWQQAGRYCDNEYDYDLARRGTQTVHDMLAARPDAPRTKLIAFMEDHWETAAAVALVLTREGNPCVVPPWWRIHFGDDHAPPDLFDGWKDGTGGRIPVDVWHIAPAKSVDPAWAARYPLVRDCALLPGLPALNPAAGDAVVAFGGARRNSDIYVLNGWSPPDGDKSTAWSDGRAALVAFAPGSVPAGAAVEAGLYFTGAYLAGGKRAAQQVRLTFNGQNLGTWRIDAHTSSPQIVSIPAVVWNAKPTAAFVLEFPDAVSPQSVGENSDAHDRAVAGEKLVFHLVPAPAD